MKIILAAINSKYIHTSLSVREIGVYLNEQGLDCELKEYSINDEIFRVAADILKSKPDIVGISCYIWNAEKCIEAADILKKANPKIKIVLGGPQAAYNAEKYMKEYPFTDVIIKGEGETAFRRILTENVSGIIEAEPLPLDEKPFPYTEEDLRDSNKIFYYETSKGCPYSCSYCLSSAEKGIRYKNTENAVRELKRFSDSGVRIVKLVDRTFNSDLRRSCDILREILKFNTKTQFHFEIAADRVNDEFIDILSRFDDGIIRIEAGLQSVNEKTLKAVHRNCNLGKLAENTRRILEDTKAVYHLDLIAGLPYEDMESFKKSFDFAFNLHPHELQLGFLKVLPGTLIAKEAEMHGIKHSLLPPYEIISNNYMSFGDLIRLKKLEAVLDLFHNSGLLRMSEEKLTNAFESPFGFFDRLAEFADERDLLITPHHRSVMFGALHDFAVINGIDAEYELAADFLTACKGAPVPEWFGDAQPLSKEKIYAVLTDDEKINALPKLKEVRQTARHKYARFVQFKSRILLHSYPDDAVADVTKWYEDY